jgi:hypothetical protein
MSGSSVAYHLRVNKYIDRRLFIETLGLVGRCYPVSQFAYISMGGGYLEDFRVLHQAFGIRAMLSFDMDDWVIGRQLVNRPYGFIRCEKARSEEVIDRFDEERAKLVGTEGNVIVWLDYTEANRRYEQLTELQALTGKLVPGDVFRITLNAQRSAFGSNDQYLMAKKIGKTEYLTAAEWWLEKLADQLQDYLPQGRNNSESMDSEAEFAVTLAQAVKRAALNGLNSRPELVIEPLLTVRYADGRHQMLTLTALVLREDKRKEFRERAGWSEWQYKPGEEWDACVHLGVPHLSPRERQLIHEVMNAEGQMSPAELLAFRLDEREDRHAEMVKQYWTHYRRYPTFAPTDIL